VAFIGDAGVLVEQPCMELVVMADLACSPDKRGLDQEVGRRAVFGVEQDVELFCEYVPCIALHIVLDTVQGGDVGVVFQELFGGSAEGDHVELESREEPSQVVEQRGEQDTVAEFFLGEDDDGSGLLWAGDAGRSFCHMLQEAGK